MESFVCRTVVCFHQSDKSSLLPLGGAPPNLQLGGTIGVVMMQPDSEGDPQQSEIGGWLHATGTEQQRWSLRDSAPSFRDDT